MADDKAAFERDLEMIGAATSGPWTATDGGCVERPESWSIRCEARTGNDTLAIAACRTRWPVAIREALRVPELEEENINLEKLALSLEESKVRLYNKTIEQEKEIERLKLDISETEKAVKTVERDMTVLVEEAERLESANAALKAENDRLKMFAKNDGETMANQRKQKEVLQAENERLRELLWEARPYVYDLAVIASTEHKLLNEQIRAALADTKGDAVEQKTQA